MTAGSTGRAGRWGLVAVAAGATTGLLLSPFGAPADRTGPLTALACAALAVLVVVEARHPLLGPGPLAAVAGGLLVLAVAVPPRTSHDLWAYAMYGRIVAVHHADPYRTRPSAFPEDPALRRVDPGWRESRSVYGPAFTGMSAAVARAAGGSALAARVAYQAMAALATGAVLAALARQRRTAAMAAIGLHPLVVVSLVNGGHNDALVGLLLLVAAWAVVRPRPVVAGLAAAAAVMIKVVALLPAIALIAWLLRRHGVRVAASAGGALGGAVALGYAAVGGPAALRPLAAAAGQVSRASAWHPLSLQNHHGLHAMALIGLLVAVPAALVTLARLGGTPAAAAAAGITPYLLAAPYVLPWYFAWVLPVAAFSDDRGLAAVVFAESVLMDLAYTYRVVPHADALDRVLRSVSGVTQMFEVLALAALVGAAVVVLLRPRVDTRPALPQDACACR